MQGFLCSCVESTCKKFSNLRPLFCPRSLLNDRHFSKETQEKTPEEGSRRDFSACRWNLETKGVSYSTKIMLNLNAKGGGGSVQ